MRQKVQTSASEEPPPPCPQNVCTDKPPWLRTPGVLYGQPLTRISGLKPLN